MTELTDALNQLKEMQGGLKTRPQVLFYDGKEIKFKLKDVITGRIADKIIELSEKYPLDAFDLLTVQLHRHVTENPDLENSTEKFVGKYKYTSYQINAYNDEDKTLLNRLDSRKNVVEERRDVLYKFLIEVIDYKDLNADVWKLINAKTKAGREFWENQDLEMLEEIYRSFRSRI